MKKNNRSTSRQLGLWGKDGQKRIDGGEVAVGGLGGVGSAVAMMLAKAGLGEISICDRDVVQEENICEQIFARFDCVGMKKTQICSEELRRHSNDIKINIVDGDLTDEAVAKELVNHADIIVSGVDNAAARIALGKAASKNKVPFVVSANIGWSIFHTVYMPGKYDYRNAFCDIMTIKRDGFPDFNNKQTKCRIENRWHEDVVAVSQYEASYLQRYKARRMPYLWYTAAPALYAASLAAIDIIKILTNIGIPTVYPSVIYFNMKYNNGYDIKTFKDSIKKGKGAT